MKILTPQILHIGSRTVLDANHVAYFEASSNYTVVHLHNKEKLIVATTLGIIENRVADFGFFVRPNRGIMVNARFVKSFDRHSVLLRNSVDIFISRRKRRRVFQELSLLLEANQPTKAVALQG